MLRVVVDARHHVGAAEPLRVLERRVGDELAGFQVDEPHARSWSCRGPSRCRGSGRWSGRFLHRRWARMRSPSRVTAGSSAVVVVRRRAGAGRCRSMRIWPRRIVWHVISPSSAGDAALAREAEAAGPDVEVLLELGRRQTAGPSRSVTSTMHSLHLPCVTQDVGTRTPARSAASNSDVPGVAAISMSVDGERDRHGRLVLPVGARLRAPP